MAISYPQSSTQFNVAGTNLILLSAPGWLLARVPGRDTATFGHSHNCIEATPVVYFLDLSASAMVSSAVFSSDSRYYQSSTVPRGLWPTHDGAVGPRDGVVPRQLHTEPPALEKRDL